MSCWTSTYCTKPFLVNCYVTELFLQLLSILSIFSQSKNARREIILYGMEEITNWITIGIYLMNQRINNKWNLRLSLWYFFTVFDKFIFMGLVKMLAMLQISKKYAKSSLFSLFQVPHRLVSTSNALGNFHKPLFSCFKSSQYSHRIAQQFMAILWKKEIAS